MTSLPYHVLFTTNQQRVSFWDNGQYLTSGHQLNGMLSDTALSSNLLNCSQMAPFYIFPFDETHPFLVAAICPHSRIASDSWFRIAQRSAIQQTFQLVCFSIRNLKYLIKVLHDLWSNSLIHFHP